MKTIILTISVCFLLLSCQTGSKEVELRIDDKQAFARKLADFYFMDSWISRSTKIEKDSIRNMLYMDFEKLHEMSVENFHIELEELRTDPIVFAEIMDSVSVILKNKGGVKKK